jgi:predicted metalloendopeptidase
VDVACYPGSMAKLKTLYVGIGYPKQSQDYSTLVIDPQDAVGSLRRWRTAVTATRWPGSGRLST